LWGIGLLAIGVLIFIAEISWLVNSHDNVLGPWAGLMALGLNFMFGTVPALFVPVGTILFGWRTLRSKPTPVLAMIIWIVLAFELCEIYPQSGALDSRLNRMPWATWFRGSFTRHLPTICSAPISYSHSPFS
jgi:MFS superfamily sulfate permease-like transporter